MIIRTLTYLFILFLLLSGCGKSSAIRDDGTPADPAYTAKQLEKQGHFQEAAEEYLRVAGQSNPPTRQGHQLSAIRVFLKANNFPKAKAELAKLDVNKSYGIEIPLILIHAKIDLAEQRINQAEKRLSSINQAKLPASLLLEYKNLHTQILAARGKVLTAVNEWIALGNLTSSKPSLLRDNNQRLWKSLSTLSLSELKKVQQKNTDIFSGWIALAVLAKTSRKSHLQQGINHWQLRFPNHPAIQDIVPHLAQYVGQTSANPTQVALLLPSTNSKFGKPAKAIEKGIFAGLKQNDDHEITVKYINEDNVVKVYQQMVNKGTDIVLGPLVKSTISALVDNQIQLPVPTLALNHLDESVTTGNLYQFGLLPEDEAKEAARRAWVDGHRIVLVLVPDGSWGEERILEAFTVAWEKQGGQIAAVHIYGKDFETSIPQMLRESAESADMAFMVAFPEIARKIRQFFISSLNDRLPIYSTSHVYSGTPDWRADRKLDGIMFMGMPWILAPDQSAFLLKAALRKIWPTTDLTQFKSLYALGIDVYTLLSRLQQLTHSPLQGQTGLLSIDNKGVIHRNNLLWARFVNGRPQLID